MTRRAATTKADIRRAIEAAQAAGIVIAEVTVTAEGAVRIIPAGAEPQDDFETWKRDNDARRQTGHSQGHSHRPAKAG